MDQEVIEVTPELEEDLDAHAAALGAGEDPDRRKLALRGALKAARFHGTPARLVLAGDHVTVHLAEGTSMQVRVEGYPKQVEPRTIDDARETHEPHEGDDGT